MPDARRRKAFLTLLHIIFFLSGIATVLIGQILPIMSRHFGLNDLEVSFLFPSQFTGSLCGTAISSLLAKRGKYLASTVMGGLAMAGGMLAINVDSFVVCLVGFYCLGIGVGLTLPSINMMIVEANPTRSAPALSILNFFWGLGAIVCKPFVDAFSTSNGIGKVTVLLSVPLVFFSVLLFLTTAGEEHAPVVNEIVKDETPIWRTPMAWAIAAFNFIHVGFESGIGGWMTTYTGRMPGELPISWMSPIVFYFLLFIIGRGVAPLLFRVFNENKMLFLGLSIVLVGMLVSITAADVKILCLGSAMAGFGTSWVFPTNVSRFTKTFGPSASRRATPLFICGTLGSALVTWLIGYLSNRTGDLRYGMAILGVSIVLLLVLQIGLALNGKRSSRLNSATADIL